MHLGGVHVGAAAAAAQRGRRQPVEAVAVHEDAALMLLLLLLLQVRLLRDDWRRHDAHLPALLLDGGQGVDVVLELLPGRLLLCRMGEPSLNESNK